MHSQRAQTQSERIASAAKRNWQQEVMGFLPSNPQNAGASDDANTVVFQLNHRCQRCSTIMEFVDVLHDSDAGKIIRV